MQRSVKTKVGGMRTQDGAGVSLVRVLGSETAHEFDPILMLDSFDSTDPADYTAGFPMHPHRGIETISYVSRGGMIHRDGLGNEDAIADGEVQWMNSGSGIMHEEMIPAADRLLGVQLWLNLPARDKMSRPSYTRIGNSEIEEIELEGGTLRLLAGSYGSFRGHQGAHLPLDYYDIHLDGNSKVTLSMGQEDSVMIFALVGDVFINDERIEEKSAASMTQGTSLTIRSGDSAAQVLYMSSRPLREPIAWAGPIVMNTRAEVQEAFSDLRNGSFIREGAVYGE